MLSSKKKIPELVYEIIRGRWRLILGVQMHLKEVLLLTREGDSTSVHVLGFTLVGWWRPQNVTPLPQPNPLIFTFATTLLVLLYIAMEYFDFDNFWGFDLKREYMQNLSGCSDGLCLGYFEINQTSVTFGLNHSCLVLHFKRNLFVVVFISLFNGTFISLEFSFLDV
jgi:hypothetical protein